MVLRYRNFPEHFADEMSGTEKPSSTSFDVVIIGAGISGINAAYRVQTQLPGSSYTILEARGGIGGTWDFFRYPGIRSDSDLHTFGFPWRPWTEQRPIADGASIVNYIRETASAEGIDKHIQFHHKLITADWSSDEQAWRLAVDADGEKKYLHARFLILGTGYYDYAEPLRTTISGMENFKGTIVHPQFWPEDLDYAGKNIVVIGSGATAVTLLPSLAEKAAHVTMLQRSPGYLLTIPNHNTGSWARALLPAWLAHKVDRLRFMILPFLFYNFCRMFPNAARNILRSATVKQLPKTIPHDPHFEPTYNPWDQRMCMCPDGDFYKALRQGTTSVATGHIKTITPNSVVLQSGQEIDADIIVTATGLKLQLAGGAMLSVDGQRINISDKFLWKGVMMQDLPNLAFVIGYTNASWTLGADATALLVCRLINYMKKNGATSATPRVANPEKLKSMPVLDLNSTYIAKAKGAMPKAGNMGPWKARSNYFVDYYNAKFGDINTGLEFKSVST